MARYFVFNLESYNSKKKKWEHRTSTSSLAQAKSNCAQMSKYEKKRWKITKEELLYIYDETGKIQK